MFSRAPVVHDFTIAFTAWGFLDVVAPDALVELRRHWFTGLSHSYEMQRAVVDIVPESTLRMSPQQVTAAYPARWRELIGV